MTNIDLSSFDQEPELNLDAFDEPEVASKVEESPDLLEKGNAYVTGLRDQSLFDFGDEAVGGAEKLLAKLDPTLSSEDYESVYGNRSIDSLADAERSRMSDLQDRNKGTYLAGRLSGGLLQSAALPNPAGVLSNVALGAGQGALSGLGSGTGDLSNRLGEAKKGALYGGLGAGAGQALAKGIPAAVKAAGTLGNKLVIGATGASTGDLMKILQQEGGKGKLSDLANYMIKKGIVKPGSNADDISDRIKSLLSSSNKELGGDLDEVLGSQKGGIFETLESAAPSQSTASSLKGDLHQMIDNLPTADKQYSGSLRTEVEKMLGELDPNQPLSYADINRFKSNLGKTINWARRQADPAEAQYSKLYGALKNKITSAADEGSQTIPGLRGEVDNVFEEQSMLRTLKPMAIRGAARDTANNLLGPGSLISAGTGLAAGLSSDNPNAAWMYPIAGALGYKAFKSRGGSTLGPALMSLSQKLTAAPQAFGKYAQVLQKAASRSPQDLAVANFVLGEKDPEYRKMMEQQRTNEN